MSRNCFRLLVSLCALSVSAAGCSDPSTADAGQATNSDGASSAYPSSPSSTGTSSGGLAPTTTTADSSDPHTNSAAPTAASSGTTSTTASEPTNDPSSIGGDGIESTSGDGSTSISSAATDDIATDDTATSNTADDDSIVQSDAGNAGGTSSGDAASGPLLAFPGAEGFGRNATGGRGGEVVHVTNLNDSGAGSFRDAVSQSNRTVVFDVGGVIQIDSRVVIKSNITVAG